MSTSTKWTPAQELAINTKGKTLLISAAAGSGKTATLTRRIIKSLTDDESPADISRILVVTFTVSAASELKQRISSALSKEIAINPTNRHLSKQLIMLESARICTIDSFAYSVVKENFQRLSLPAGFKIGDSSQIFMLHKEIMEDIIEQHYTKNDSDNDFITFVENFIDTTESSPLSITLLDLYDRLSSRAEGITFAAKSAERLAQEADLDFFETLQGKIICERLIKLFSYYKDCFEKSCEVITAIPEAQKSYYAAFSSDLAWITDMLEALKSESYAKAKQTLSLYNKVSLSNLSSEFKTEEIIMAFDMRTEFSKALKSLSAKYFSLTQEKISQSMKESAKILHSIYLLLDEFQKRSMEEKYRRGEFAFNDITRFAVDILTDENGEPSDIALAYAKKFNEIYIDEYQDVSPIQDLLFRLISRPNNRFMVGDIKQSIYCFRNAEPDIFSNYKKTFPNISPEEDPSLCNSDSASIFMSENFRCDENIIKFTNRVFSHLFSYCGDSINYSKNDDLKFSKKEEGRTMPSPPVTVKVIYHDKENKDNNEENKEAIWVANEISRLIRKEKKADGTLIEPKDIAIILRSGTHAPDFTQALSRLGIKFKGAESKDIFNTPDILLMLSLLSVVDNPQRDITLAATLYSPLFSYTMSDLIKIRRSADKASSLFDALENYHLTSDPEKAIVEKNTYFINKLRLYRNYANSVSVDKLINYIYNDLSILSMDHAVASNLMKLYEMARTFEASSFKGLNSFIFYVNDLIENDRIPDAFGKTNDSSNAVTISTIHNSKGLEYPVCFIANIQSDFSDKDTRKEILYSSKAGIAFRLVHQSGFAKINTPLREATAIKMISSQKEEELRLMYVALTRARERLYLTAKLNKNHSVAPYENRAAKNAFFPGEFNLFEMNNMLSWILAAIYPLEDSEYHTFEFIKDSEIEPSGAHCGDNSTSAHEVGVDALSELKDRFAFKYPYEHLNKLPAKLSVSKLTPSVLDDVDDDSLSLEAANDAHILEISEFFDSRSRASSADRGTATHLFLQFCDFENASKFGIDAELNRLVEKRFISKKVADLINKKQIERFFQSDFFEILSKAKSVFREQRFNILLPASHFTENDEFSSQIKDESILVQGVIDLFFTANDGSLILCDYKTDHLTDEEKADPSLAKKKLKERHGEQLSYYSMAIEQMCGKKPDKVFIYSLPFGDALEIQ